MPEVRELGFPGSTGARLQGALHVPDGSARGSVLLAHCFTCSKDQHTMTRLGSGLSEAGYAALRFDFTGIGDSGGDFADKTVTHNVRDIVAAATALIREGFGPCAAIGHSLGGAALLLAAPRIRTIRSIVTIGAPSSADHVRHLLTGSESEIREQGVAEVDIGGRPFPISREFLEALQAHDDTSHIGELERPLLVLHAPGDGIVPVSEGERIFDAARQPKAFIPLVGADHLLTDPEHAAVALDAVLGWFDRTLPG